MLGGVLRVVVGWLLSFRVFVCGSEVVFLVFSVTLWLVGGFV